MPTAVRLVDATLAGSQQVDITSWNNVHGDIDQPGSPSRSRVSPGLGPNSRLMQTRLVPRYWTYWAWTTGGTFDLSKLLNGAGARPFGRNRSSQYQIISMAKVSHYRRNTGANGGTPTKQAHRHQMEEMSTSV